MSPLSIVFTIVVIVLVFMILRYLMVDPNTLQNLQDGKTTSTIDATSLATNGSNVARATITAHKIVNTVLTKNSNVFITFYFVN